LEFKVRCKGIDSELKAVLFDLDGTLIDSKRDIAASANITRQHYGFQPLPEDLIGTFVGLGIMVLLEKAVETKDPDRLREAHGIFKEHYRLHCVDFTRPYAGTFEILESLKGRGIKLAVVSNKPQEFTDLILKRLDLWDFFDVVLGPEATLNKKPHPEPLLTAAGKLGAEPSETVMIGDSTVDIEAARAARMLVGVITHGYGTREILSAADPDWLVDSLQDFMDILL
jgi:phosphoglycolate phosphatase